MTLRKIYIAVECADDAQKERVQAIAEDLSGMKVLDGNMLESVYPQLKAKRGEIYQLVQHLRQNGAKGVKSIKFLTLLGNLMV